MVALYLTNLFSAVKT